MDNKLRIKTVNVVAGTETLVEMPHSHAYVRNIGEEKVYASTSPDIIPYDDGVIEIKPNRTKVLANIFDVKKGVGEIYLLSVGDTVCEIESTNVLNFSETVEGGDGSSSGSGSGENGKDGRGILKIAFLSSTGGDVAGIEGAVDTYQITYTDGTKSTYDVTNGSKGTDGEKGVSIVSVAINDNKHLIVEFSDGNIQDIGKLPQSDVDLTNYYTINEANDKINTEIQSSLENYVQKDGNKVLSTNDYTTVEKTKLAGLTNYDDTEIKNNITTIQTTVDKKVDKVDGYSLVLDSEIEKLSAITNPIKVKGRVNSVDVLPADATIGDLYFVGTEGSEDYKEYVLTEDGVWEQIGVSKIDLSAYVLKDGEKGLSSNDFTDNEKEKLANLENYDDTEIKANIAKKVDKKDGYSLVSDTEITRLAEVKNYDDTQVKNDIAINLSSIGMSRKNLLPYRFVSGNAGGVTVTVDNDGVLSLSGETKASLTYNLNFPTPLVFDRDVYIIGATSLTDIRYHCKVDTKVGGSFYPQIGLDGLLIPKGTAIEYLYIQQSTIGTTVSATIQPMICYADITDITYEPYTPSLQEQINDIVARLTALEG